ncbi:hypothetical protein [Acinetobacter pittii]|uniref:hypothetical protein n=1 Tax=Acinetobacter pittii TaxID=48296 RepID=UPI0030195C8C
MMKFTDADILKLDETFAKEGIPFHARPLQAAREILGKNFSINLMENPLVIEIKEAYERLIPEVKYTWPGMGTGLVASVDQVKKVTIAVIFGSVNISIDKGLGFSNHQEWSKWCRGSLEIANRSAFAFADMYDLFYGIDESDNTSKTYWGLASDQLKLVAESLCQTGAISSPILQPICLTVELAIKGTLLYLGIPEKDLRNSKLFGHNLVKLAQRMIQEKSHRDDQLILTMLSKFPDYVSDRYRETNLTRLEVISLALSAQFIAASAVRRISGRDIAEQVETSIIVPRSNYFT